MPRISAACNQLRAPLKARKMTSCRFIARSTAAVSQSIGTSLVTDVSTALRPKSGHFTCSRERTDHELPTVARAALAFANAQGYARRHSPHVDASGGDDGAPSHV